MGKPRILIVEDEVIIANNIKISLEQMQYDVSAIVSSGEKAIEQTAKIHPDLVLMDIKLRGKMDGVETAQVLKQKFDIPVVYMTAYIDNDTFQRAKLTEPFGYILKPFEVRDLRSTIEMALYKYEMEQKLKHSEARYRRLFEQSAAILADTEALYHFSLTLITASNLSNLLQDVVQKLVDILPARWVSVITVDTELQQIKQIIKSERDKSYSLLDSFDELNEGLSGWVIRHQKPALSSKGKADPRESTRVQQRRIKNKAGAILVVPLYYRGKVLGTITASNRLDDPDFTQRDVKLMTAMANQTAIAIENARLFETAQQQVTELEAVHQASLSLTSSLNPQTVLEDILRSTVKLVPGIIKAIIYLYREETLDFAAVLVTDQKMDRDIPLPRPDGITYTVAREKQMRVIPDTSHHPRYATVPEYWEVAIISLPLKIRQRVVGVMNIFHDAPHDWPESELRILRLLGDQAAIAIENARLHEQTQHDAETKAALLEEINHRVKNNLSTIIGLLYALQQYDTPQQNFSLENLINRIEGLATVHNLLAISEWNPLPLSDLANYVISSATQSLPHTKQVLIDVSGADVFITPGQATNLTMIFHELATNAINHATAETQDVKIHVNIVRKNNTVRICFSDNGPGFPQAVLNSEQHNVGLYIVKTVVRDGLRGKIELCNNQGATVCISYRPMP